MSRFKSGDLTSNSYMYQNENESVEGQVFNNLTGVTSTQYENRNSDQAPFLAQSIDMSIPLTESLTTADSAKPAKKSKNSKRKKREEKKNKKDIKEKKDKKSSSKAFKPISPKRKFTFDSLFSSFENKINNSNDNER